MFKKKYTIDMPLTIDSVQQINGFTVRKGMYENLGATVFPGGVNFVIHTREGTSVELLLFHRNQKEPYGVIPIPESYKIGDVYAITVFGLKVDNLEYAYHIDGPYDEAKGLLFDKNAVILDPYAKAIAGQNIWGKKNTGCYRGKVSYDTFEWGEDCQSDRKLSDLIIYEMHVRGFTNHESSKVKHPGTFAGLKEKIPYLKELGINAVELMPIFEFDECINERQYNGKRLLEYWGYNTVGFFAPNTSYSAANNYNHEGKELKQLIKELHRHGIEVILDVVFNHTAEGNEKGQFFSFKGLDNNVYYMLTPEGDYYNFSGCGNTLNCNHPIVQNMIIECLRYWTITYHVDGFRFDLASILGRNEDGYPMTNPPLLRSLAYDPLLANVKLIAEAWDAGGMYQVGSFPASKRWAEWNGRYRDTMRRFLKGESWRFKDAVYSLFGSEDLYGSFDYERNKNYAGYDSCINFITCHDGFTMHDLYSYNEKHNEDNGWDNTDGANDNLSWNCGAEGETDDEDVLKLREQMIRNACAVLMCSRGTPMFLAGDEFGNSQFGNNNSYCQDNERSWLDWGLLEKKKEQFAFFSYMINFRKKHPVISRHLPNAVCGMPTKAIYDRHGNRMRDVNKDEKLICAGFAGYNRERRRDDVVFVAVNTNWKDERIELPGIKGHGKWRLCVNTCGDMEGKCFYQNGREPVIEKEFYMRPRSVAVFIADFM